MAKRKNRHPRPVIPPYRPTRRQEVQTATSDDSPAILDTVILTEVIEALVDNSSPGGDSGSFSSDGFSDGGSFADAGGSFGGGGSDGSW